MGGPCIRHVDDEKFLYNFIRKTWGSETTLSDQEVDREIILKCIIKTSGECGLDVCRGVLVNEVMKLVI
jgi:hypothetical protein